MHVMDLGVRGLLSTIPSASCSQVAGKEGRWVQADYVVPVYFSSALQSQEGIGDEVGKGSGFRESVQQRTRSNNRGFDLSSVDSARSGFEEAWKL